MYIDNVWYIVTAYSSYFLSLIVNFCLSNKESLETWQASCQLYDTCWFGNGPYLVTEYAGSSDISRGVR